MLINIQKALNHQLQLVLAVGGRGCIHPGMESYGESGTSLLPQASKAVTTTTRGRRLCCLQGWTSSTAKTSQWLEQRLAIHREMENTGRGQDRYRHLWVTTSTSAGGAGDLGKESWERACCRRLGWIKDSGVKLLRCEWRISLYDGFFTRFHFPQCALSKSLRWPCILFVIFLKKEKEKDKR